MSNLLDNLEHINIIDKLIRVKITNNDPYTLPLLVQVVSRMFPEYRQDPMLESKLGIILSYQ